MLTVSNVERNRDYTVRREKKIVRKFLFGECEWKRLLREKWALMWA